MMGDPIVAGICWMLTGLTGVAVVLLGLFAWQAHRAAQDELESARALVAARRAKSAVLTAGEDARSLA